MPNIDEGRGPLGSIADRTAAKEIGKLWTFLENRFPQTTAVMPDHAVVTHADLKLLRQDVTQRVDALPPAVAPAPRSGGSGSAGIDLRNLDNVWGGKNVFPSLQVQTATGKTPADSAVLVSALPGGGRFSRGISIGSAAGVLTCDVGIDMGYAHIDTAAIIIPSGSPIVFSAPAAALIRYTGSNFRFEVGGDVKALINSGGQLTCKTLNIAEPGGSATAGALFGYFEINLGGFRRKVPFYAV